MRHQTEPEFMRLHTASLITHWAARFSRCPWPHGKERPKRTYPPPLWNYPRTAVAGSEWASLRPPTTEERLSLTWRGRPPLPGVTSLKGCGAWHPEGHPAGMANVGLLPALLAGLQSDHVVKLRDAGSTGVEPTVSVRRFDRSEPQNLNAFAAAVEPATADLPSVAIARLSGENNSRPSRTGRHGYAVGYATESRYTVIGRAMIHRP